MIASHRSTPEITYGVSRNIDLLESAKGEEGRVENGRQENAHGRFSTPSQRKFNI